MNISIEEVNFINNQISDSILFISAETYKGRTPVITKNVNNDKYGMQFWTEEDINNGFFVNNDNSKSVMVMTLKELNQF